MDALINLKDCSEFMTLTFNGKTHLIRLAGTTEEPYFCGKDVCTLLEYSNVKNALFKLVDDEDKKSLDKLLSEVVSAADTTNQTVVQLGKIDQHPTYNEGKAVYISEPGLYSLIMASHAPVAKDFRKVFEPQIVALKASWKSQERTMDLFEFIKERHPALHRDVNEPWFQQIWMPLCVKQFEGQRGSIQGPHLGALESEKRQGPPLGLWDILGPPDGGPRINHIVVTDAWVILGRTKNNRKSSRSF